MYVLPPFGIADTAAQHELVRAHPLGTWIVLDGGEPVANPIPFLLDPSRGEFGTLVGHVARANPVWKTCARGEASLVVFQGPQAYVSPSWYASKREHGKVVPTWNYATVQAHGVARALEDPADVLRIVSQLTDQFEAGREHPWRVADAPAEFTAQLARVIVGIEIPLTRLVGKWKVSQNRGEADRAGVATGLRAETDAQAGAMASLVERPPR